MLIYIHIGRWGVSASRVFWRLPPAHSCSSSARSWSYRASCHWQRALGSGQRPCSLDSSTLSGQLGLFGQRHAGGNMTSDSGAGSRADSSDSHTLGPSSSSRSLRDFDDSTRCARQRLLKPTCPDGLRRPLAGWFYRPPSCPTVAPSLVRRRWPLWAPPPSSASTWCRTCPHAVVTVRAHEPGRRRAPVCLVRDRKNGRDP